MKINFLGNPGNKPHILITGANGFVGNKLFSYLDQEEYDVFCMTRKPEELEKKLPPKTKIVKADALNISSLKEAFKDVDTAYYLIHSMDENKNFFEIEQECAKNFAQTAKECNVKKIIYLGGLSNPNVGRKLSKHLDSRFRTGEILRKSGIPVIEIQSSIILDEKSSSFNLLKKIVERMPKIALMPRVVKNKTQPIASEDIIRYLAESIKLKTDSSLTIQAGSQRMSYADLMKAYAKEKGLKRCFIYVPFKLPEKGYKLFLKYILKLNEQEAVLGSHLLVSAKNKTIVSNDLAQKLFENIQTKDLYTTIKEIAKKI